MGLLRVSFFRLRIYEESKTDGTGCQLWVLLFWVYSELH